MEAGENGVGSRLSEHRYRPKAGLQRCLVDILAARRDQPVNGTGDRQTDRSRKRIGPSPGAADHAPTARLRPGR
jgi:hypothetical protein